MKYRKLSELTKLENNPRTITKEDFEILKKSISDNKDYFEARPLILSNRTGQLVIIGGNQRYEASKALGLDEVPTYLLENLTEEKEREIIIRDNVNNGEMDWDKLANEWEQEKLDEWGLEIKFNNDKQTLDGTEFEPMYKIEIDCKNEAEQQKIYNELTELGYICKTSTL